MRPRLWLAVLRLLCLALVFALLAGGCRPITRPAADAGAKPAAASPAIDPTHQQVIEQFLTVWNSTDNKLDGVVSDDFVMHNADIAEMNNAAAILYRIQDAHSMVPDFHQVPLDVFGDGEWYVARSNLGGTWAGEEPVYGALNLLHVVDSRIVEAWQVSDEVAVDKMVGGFPNDEHRYQFPWGDTSAVTGAAGDPATNRALAEQWFIGDDATRQALAAKGYAFHSTMYPEQNDFAGRQAAIADLLVSFPDMSASIDEPVVAVGDKVGFKFTATGTSQGKFLGLKPDGKQYTWPGIAIYRIADGKIADEWILWSMDNLYYEIQF